MSVECAVTVKCGQETVSITAPYNESLFALLLRRGFLQHRDTARRLRALRKMHRKGGGPAQQNERRGALDAGG